MGARIVSLVNQKGGVGKTTTAVSLAVALARRGQRVLLVDLDPQANATSALGVLRSDRPGVYDALLDETPIDECIARVEAEGVDLVPSSAELSGAEVELVPVLARERRLVNALQPVRERYDWVLIDCPPSLGLLTVNALVVAHAVLVPLQCEFFALEGLSLLLRTIERVRRTYNPTLHVEGVVLTMFDRRNNLSEQVETDVRSFLGERVFETVIPRNVRVSEAPSHGLPVLLYDLRCPGSKAYARLAGEMLRRAPELAPAA